MWLLAWTMFVMRAADAISLFRTIFANLSQWLTFIFSFVIHAAIIYFTVRVLVAAIGLCPIYIIVFFSSVSGGMGYHCREKQDICCKEKSTKMHLASERV
uniref:Uncharacterized protein n=1 Tax=Amblyomma triste TaxID=251400 RepID=A0A023G405_AMBTT